MLQKFDDIYNADVDKLSKRELKSRVAMQKCTKNGILCTCRDCLVDNCREVECGELCYHCDNYTDFDCERKRDEEEKENPKDLDQEFVTTSVKFTALNNNTTRVSIGWLSLNYGSGEVVIDYNHDACTWTSTDSQYDTSFIRFIVKILFKRIEVIQEGMDESGGIQ